MQKRRLGKSNLEVSALGRGCMGMSFHRSAYLETGARQMVTHQTIAEYDSRGGFFVGLSAEGLGGGKGCLTERGQA
jgi:aryl-alcohol dehydrogenase-like predicted oxidoreductase